MVQLELDLRFTSDRTEEETTFYRSRILRKLSPGRKVKTEKSREISFEDALSTLLQKTDAVFSKLSDDRPDIDRWVSKSLKGALPNLMGKEGNFRSFSHFRSTEYKTIVRHNIIDRYRGVSGSQHKSAMVDGSAAKEVRGSRRIGFQPTLFRLSEEQTRAEQAVEQLLADLKKLDGVLEPDSGYLKNSSPHRRRALELRLQNPHFTSGSIAMILELEGYGKFKGPTIRVWELRAKRSQGQNQLTGV